MPPKPSPTRSSGALARLLVVALLAAIGGPSVGGVALAVGAEDSNPFAIRLHDVPGRILQVWPLRVSACEDDSGDLLILSTDGPPPSPRRFATFMPCGSALAPRDPRIVVRSIGPEVVFVDVARFPGRTGPQLVSVSAAGLRFESLVGPPDPVDRAVAGGLPLPPGPWDFGRLPLVEAWNDDGRPMALVPSLAGAWLVDLGSDAVRRIELPVYARYEGFMPFLPDTVWRWLVSEVSWPTLARADDDGDGRLDLFALSRWDVWIYRAGPSGLPSQPTRRLRFVPFDEKVERRPGATATNYFARDLDGDARADLVLNTIQGGLMDGRSTTRIHRNGGHGVELAGPPAAQRETRGGFASVDFVDLEGDGQLEIVETSFEFGVVALVKLLVSQRAETHVRILALDPKTPGGLRTVFEDEVALALDFRGGRFADVLPGFGDWNGDGLLDLFVSRGGDAIGFRMGSRAPDAPRLGPLQGSQPLPLASGASRIADLNGDGLDEIVAFSTTDPDPPLVVLENRGRLPGSRSRLLPR